MLLFHTSPSSYAPPRATVRGGFLFALLKNVKKIEKNVKKVLTNRKGRAIIKSQRGQKAPHKKEDKKMKRYLFDEQKGKVQGEMMIVEAENAIEAMEKAGMAAHVGPYDTFDTMYFGKIYGVKEVGAANYEYYCHR